MAGAEEPLIDLGEAFRVLRRRRVLVASILALAVSGAVVYLAIDSSAVYRIVDVALRRPEE